MIYKMSCKDYDKRPDPFLFEIETGKLDAYEFFKTECCIPAKDEDDNTYYIYDSDTIKNFISFIESSYFMQFTSDNKKLYILRKLLGVYDNGISQNLKSIEKAFRETFEIDIESDEFFEILIKAEDMIKKYH